MPKLNIWVNGKFIGESPGISQASIDAQRQLSPAFIQKTIEEGGYVSIEIEKAEEEVDKEE